MNFLKKLKDPRVLTVLGMVFSGLAFYVESEQRKQDNHEIAVEVVHLLKEEKVDD